MMDIRDTEKNYSFEQKEQKAQKVFWVVVVFFLAAALLGLFGKDGPMSTAVLDSDELYIKYERFMRDESPSEISLFVKRSRGDSIDVAINRTYVENINIQEVTPQPIQVRTGKEQIMYTFKVGEGGLIIINILPQDWGTMNLQITLHGKTYHLKQYTYF